MKITADEICRERRKTEELLRQVVRAYLDADQLEDALRLVHSTREWILGEIEDEQLELK